jgi:hypothetical protein
MAFSQSEANADSSVVTVSSDQIPIVSAVPHGDETPKTRVSESDGYVSSFVSILKKLTLALKYTCDSSFEPGTWNLEEVIFKLLNEIIAFQTFDTHYL